jgi:hypothetical protein
VADVCFLRGRGWPSIRQEIILELLAFEPSSLLIYEWLLFLIFHDVLN